MLFLRLQKPWRIEKGIVEQYSSASSIFILLLWINAVTIHVIIVHDSSSSCISNPIQSPFALLSNVFDSLPHRSGCCLFSYSWRFLTSFLWLLQVLVFACLSISTNWIDRDSVREGRATIWIGAVLWVWVANFYYGCWCLLFLGYVKRNEIS